MTFETSKPFPYMDSDAVEDGRFGDAHTRRNIVRGGNRLLFRGGHGFHILAPSMINNTPGDGYIGDHMIRGFGRPWWTRLHPAMPLRKKPGLIRASLRCRFLMEEDPAWTNNATTRARRAIQVQVATRARPFQSEPDGSNTFTMKSDGSGTFQRTTLSGIPVHPGAFELFELWFRGGLTDELMNTAVYGNFNTQLAWGATRYNGDHTTFILDNASNWNNVHNGGHWAEFDNVPGQYVITNNPNPNELSFAPRAPHPLESTTYYIRALQPWRIGSIALYFDDRER